MKGAVTTGYNSEQDSRDTIDEVIAIAESIRKEMREKDLKLNDTSGGAEKYHARVGAVHDCLSDPRRLG